MKTFLFSIFVALLPLEVVLADDATPPGPSAPAAGAGQGQRAGEMRQAFQQLNLTDAQMAQIKQIRSTVPAGKERRQQVMAVLTPDQKAKLMEFLKEHRGARQAGGGASGNGLDSISPNSSANSNTDPDLPPP